MSYSNSPVPRSGVRHGRPPSPKVVALFQEIGRRLDAKGMIAANDGNLSLRDDDGTILVTATGARKARLRDDEVVRVDSGGALLHGVRPPSSELSMHLALLGARPDVRAVVHAHPAVATGFAVARQPMDACVLPEIVLTLGAVPIADYGTPGTEELARSLVPLAARHDVILLANHGAIALGPDLETAYDRMERLDHTARILLVAHLLGRTTRLDAAEVTRLLATAPSGGPVSSGVLPCLPATDEGDNPPKAAAASSGSSGPSGSHAQREELVASIVEILKNRGL